MPKYRSKPEHPLSEEQQQALQTFYKDNYDYFRVIASRIIRDWTMAEDIIHDSMIRVMYNIDTFLPMTPSERRAYIAPIIENAYIDYLRKKNKTQTVPLDEEAIADTVISDFDTHLDILMLEEVLTEQEWVILRKQYLEGKSLSEVAKEVDCNPDSIRMKTSRARKKAKALLLEKNRGEGKK